MYIVVIAWAYVVLMMSIAEESVVAGIMTFLFYGVLPLTIMLYLFGSRQRKARHAARRHSETGVSDIGKSRENSFDPDQ